jgi:hypothetical protein
MHHRIAKQCKKNKIFNCPPEVQEALDPKKKHIRKIEPTQSA